MVLLAGIVLLYFLPGNPLQFHHTQLHSDIPIYSYRIVKTYPHDRKAFTQGLTFEHGYLYEGTGLHGSSSLRKVELQTGKVIKIQRLNSKFFGEGITILGDRIFQLTYLSHVGFVYDKNSFKRIKEFHYPTEGWGLANDGKFLIMSDGTSMLYYLDPETFRTIKTLVVHDHRGEITKLNELEFVQGEIFANIWQEERLARIDPVTGRITGWIELPGLLKPQDMAGDIDVLNGIAHDLGTNHLFVTGKFWPKIFEIELISQK